jgi:hypothetical protein
MAKMTGQQFAEKLARNLANSTQYIKDGVNAVKDSPMAAAKAQVQRWQAAMSSTETANKWQAGLDNVELSYWKSRMNMAADQRIASGINAAKDRIAVFGDALMKHIDSIKPGLNNITSTGLQRSKDRALYWIDQMHAMQWQKPKKQ